MLPAGTRTGSLPATISPHSLACSIPLSRTQALAMAQQQIMHMPGAYGAVPQAAAVPLPLLPAAPVPLQPLRRRLRARRWQPYQQQARPLPRDIASAGAAAYAEANAAAAAAAAAACSGSSGSYSSGSSGGGSGGGSTTTDSTGGGDASSWPIHFEASAATAEGTPGGGSGSTLGSAGERLQLPDIDLDSLDMDDLDLDWQLAFPLWEGLLSPCGSAAPECAGAGTGTSHLGCAGATAGCGASGCSGGRDGGGDVLLPSCAVAGVPIERLPLPAPDVHDLQAFYF